MYVGYAANGYAKIHRYDGSNGTNFQSFSVQTRFIIKIADNASRK